MKTLRLKLHWQILIALIFSVILGFYFPNVVPYISWMGEVFLSALKMIIIPLIMSSIISGVAGMGGGKSLGRLGGKTLLYYLSTSTLAIIAGLFMVNLIQPGVGVEMGFTQTVEGLAEKTDSVKDILTRIIPENIFASMTNADILPLIFFAIIFGVFVNKTKPKYKNTLVNFFEGVFDVMMKMTLFIIKFTPLGILGIVAHEVAKNAHQLLELAGSMAIYMLTVFLALGFHAVITLPLLLRFVGRVNPFLHLKNMSTALLTAFSTASSSATLPLTMDSVERKSGVSSKIVSFTLPLGATVNMDGTALYECVAAIFIAQVYGIELHFAEQALIVVTALLASVGAAGIPMAGLVMLTVILTAVGLPLEGIGLIIAVDLILDMTRTAVNVWSDSCGAVIVARSEGEKTNIAV